MTKFILEAYKYLFEYLFPTNITFRNPKLIMWAVENPFFFALAWFLGITTFNFHNLYVLIPDWYIHETSSACNELKHPKVTMFRLMKNIPSYAACISKTQDGFVRACLGCVKVEADILVQEGPVRINNDFFDPSWWVSDFLMWYFGKKGDRYLHAPKFIWSYHTHLVNTF